MRMHKNSELSVEEFLTQVRNNIGTREGYRLKIYFLFRL